MASSSRDQALSLLAAANNHGDLAVKLSCLKQAEDVLLSVDSSLASELFPYLAELQSSPECLVRKSLVEIVEEIGFKMMESSSVLMPMLLTFLRDADSVVVKQSIISGTKLFCGVLKEMAMQLHRQGRVERWLEEMWMSMCKFRDIVIAITLEPGSVSERLLALKFLETYVLLFTSDNNESGKHLAEGGGHVFNISWLIGRHFFLDPAVLMAEARSILGTLLNLLHMASSLPGSLAVGVVN